MTRQTSPTYRSTAKLVVCKETFLPKCYQMRIGSPTGSLYFRQNLSAVCRPTVSRLSADCRPTVGQQSADVFWGALHNYLSLSILITCLLNNVEILQGCSCQSQLGVVPLYLYSPHCLLYISYCTGKENLIDYQQLLELMVISFILMTLTL